MTDHQLMLLTWAVGAFFVGAGFSGWYANRAVKHNRKAEEHLEHEGVVRFIRDDVGAAVIMQGVTNGLLAAVLVVLILR